MVDAIILAGGKTSGPLKACCGEDYEALIKFGQKPMVNYVAEALIKAEKVGNIVIIGPPQIKDALPGDNVTVISPESTPLKNLLKGLAVIDASKKVLVATCDIPLLTPDTVDKFIDMGGNNRIDFFYPIVPMESIVSLLPNIKRTSVNLEEGIYTGGNLFLINPIVVPKCVQKAEQFVELRKSPFKLCRLLGLRFVFKFLLKKLTISEIEEKVSDIFGIKGKAVITGYPDIGVDVDKPSDYYVISEYINKPA